MTNNQEVEILLYTYISSVDILVIPTATACSLPSAITATTLSGSSLVILAPGEVSPGHMMLAPLNTNLMAPLSTCMRGNMKGTADIKERKLTQFYMLVSF